MNSYLVGGAVRDQLLGYPITERDWVVVGATPEDMLKKGFRKVGRDFPVFLHPDTREEYALARTERKSGQGYYGFTCTFDPNVTLEEDLARRDITINAMARDDSGRIIDPFGGQRDLAEKILRHVSPSFVEDPVRVLRIARFAARYHHLGFKIANETRLLMYNMMKQGELEQLVPERVWQEWFRSLTEKNPDVFITTLRSCGALKSLVPELDALFGVPNPRHYHPEVDSGVHSLYALQAAVHLSADPLVRFGALVHDVGKACTPMNSWPSHIEHEIAGVKVIDTLCQRLRLPADYREFAILVCRMHLKIHAVFSLKPNTIVTALEKADAFRRRQRFENLLLVCESDAKGSGHDFEYKQAAWWRQLLNNCDKINPKIFLDQGFQGELIKKKLHDARINCVRAQHRDLGGEKEYEK